MHGGTHGRTLRPGTRSDHKNPRLGADDSRIIEEERKELRDIMNELGGVYHRHSRPGGRERVESRGPCTFQIGMLREGLVDDAGMRGC